MAASDILFSIRLGALGTAAVGAALASTKGSLDGLTRAGDVLQSRQERLGRVMAQALQHPQRALGDLRRRYDELGSAITNVQNRHQAMQRSMDRRDQLAQGREQIGGDLMGATATAAAVGAPVLAAMREAVNFGDVMNDLAIVGDLTRDEQARLGVTLRGVALSVNQTASEVARGTALLIANGMETKKAADQAALLGRFTTASRASLDDAARMMVSFDVLGVSAQDMELAFSQAATAGKLGSFEVRDMARWFPALGGQMKAIGVVGNEAVVNMASRLQIAMATAGSTDEAANNFRNFLTKLTSPDTAKDFERLGIDLQGRMLGLARQGLDPIEGAVGMIMERIGQQTPAVAQELQALSNEIAAIKDPAERATEMQRRRGMIEALGQRAGLGQVFQDMQATSYLLAELQNRDQLGRIRAQTASGRNAEGTLTLDADFARREESPAEQLKRLRIQLQDMAISIGEALLPAALSLAQALTPIALGISQWAQANPELIRLLAGVVLGVTAFKLGALAVGWAVNFLVLSPLNSLGLAWQSLAARAAIGRAAMLAGAAPMQAVAASSGRAGAAVMRLGGVIRGLGRAIMMVGRLALMNPIGLALTAAALLVYKFWGPIAGFFRGLWSGLVAGLAPIAQSVRAAFAPVVPLLAPIGSLLSRVGGWFRALIKPVEDTGGAAEAFGVRVGNGIATVVRAVLGIPGMLRALPGQMLAIGGQIVAGLIQGIRQKMAAAGQAVAELGAAVRDRLKGFLGIRSPSRVFAELGGNLSEGLALGMGARLDAVTKAAAGMAAAATVALGSTAAMAAPLLPAAPVLPEAVQSIRQALLPAAAPALPEAKLPAAAPRAAAAPASATQIHFAPVIHVGAGAPAGVSQEVQAAMRVSFDEFERLMRRYQSERARISP